jgi:rhodanese-related sulfurtransferase
VLIYLKNMKIKSSSFLVSEALKEIKTITPAEALKLSKDNKCNLIDIRDIRELEKQGRIDNSQHMPRGMLEFWMDPESVYFKDGRINMNKEMVLFCAGGLRSALAVKSLKEMGFEKISHIDGGFASMIQNGFKVNQS